MLGKAVESGELGKSGGGLSCIVYRLVGRALARQSVPRALARVRYGITNVMNVMNVTNVTNVTSVTIIAQLYSNTGFFAPYMAKFAEENGCSRQAIRAGCESNILRVLARNKSVRNVMNVTNVMRDGFSRENSPRSSRRSRSVHGDVILNYFRDAKRAQNHIRTRSVPH